MIKSIFSQFKLSSKSRRLKCAELFTEQESIIICNALHRRSEDMSTAHIEGDEEKRKIARALALEAFNYY